MNETELRRAAQLNGVMHVLRFGENVIASCVLKEDDAGLKQTNTAMYKFLCDTVKQEIPSDV
jgi:hypothetical protein